MLNRLRNVGLRPKMAVLILVFASLAIFGVVLYIGYQARIDAQRETESKAFESTRRFANMIKGEADAVMNTAKTLASSFEAMKLSGEPSRETMDAMLRRVIEEHPQYMAIWSCWEPNALDGQDAKFRNASGSDATGRYAPYLQWLGGKVTVKPYPYKGEADKVNFYQETLNSDVEVVFDPVPYEIEETKGWKIVMATPIRYKGKNIGVVGIDLPARFLEPLIKRVRFFENISYGFLMANDGRFIAHPTKWANVGRPFSDFKFQDASEKAVNNGDEASEYKVSKTTGLLSFYPFVPIYIGNADKPWSLSSNTKIAKVTEKAEKTFQFTLYVGGVAVLILAVLVWFMAGTVTKPVLRIAGTVRQVARERDLTLDVPVSSRDEVGVMGREFNNMMKALRDSFALVNDAATHVNEQAGDVAKRATANRDRAENEKKQMQTIQDTVAQMGETAGQVSQGAIDQAGGANKSMRQVEQLISSMQQVDTASSEQIQEASVATERVAAMGETAGRVTSIAQRQAEEVVAVTDAMKNIAKSVDEVTRAANRATEQGRTVLSAAEEGRSTIDATVAGMQAIKESSSQIAEIIGVITDIAEQTNLLALNAAIEAARAGVHGKGFAVVADEVGKLAQRSSEAAKEITQLIKDSTNKVEEGTRLTDRSQDALRKIAQGGEINMLAIEEIGRSADLLSDNSREVNTLVGELNKLAQEIAGMAGQQGQRREAAQKALAALVDKSNAISSQVSKAADRADSVGEEMRNIAQLSEKMQAMTETQAGRSQRLKEITTASTEGAIQTAAGAGEVVAITLEMQRLATNLTRQIAQFKVQKGLAAAEAMAAEQSNPGV